jgi:hypothetical protein
MRRPGPSSIVAALILLGAPACRTKPPGCEDATNERCLWNQGVRQPAATDSGEPGQADVTGDSSASPTTDVKLDDALTQMTDMMRAGLEWSLVDARARTLCAGDGAIRPGEAEALENGDASEVWHCDTALMIDTQSLTLEATAAVLSLTADALDEARSDELYELARARFASWCAGAFEELDGTDHLVFYRCPLPEGPFLVIARFPRDLEAGQWQVSIAVLDAG